MGEKGKCYLSAGSSFWWRQGVKYDQWQESARGEVMMRWPPKHSQHSKPVTAKKKVCLLPLCPLQWQTSSSQRSPLRKTNGYDDGKGIKLWFTNGPTTVFNNRLPSFHSFIPDQHTSLSLFISLSLRSVLPMASAVWGLHSDLSTLGRTLTSPELMTLKIHP